MLIGVDWGTSTMRAILCRGAAAGGSRPEVRVGAGITAGRGRFEDALFAAIEPWTAAYGKLPVIMAGMIGSNIGWRVTPYVDCPAPVRSIRDHCESFDARGHRLAIIPGVACRNAFGEPDFMRGEELQILGWYEKKAEDAGREHIVCLPGTHTKWVRFGDGAIETFMTAMSGELYAILGRHSILLPDADDGECSSFDEAAFRDGLALARRSGGDLLNTLFSIRSRRIASPERSGDPAARLSGLIVGADVMAGLERFAPPSGSVELIGDPVLCRKFAIALDSFDVAATVTDGVEAAHRGFESFGDVCR